jgi:hypothetical protein
MKRRVQGPRAQGVRGARISLLIAMIIATGAMRLVPHASNFTPILAIALLAGAHFRARLPAVLIPLLAMLASDCVLEVRFGSGLHSLLPVVYGAIAMTVLGGRWLQDRIRPSAVAIAAVASSAMFFVTTNFAVWAAGDLYPLTLDGLLSCYWAAVPFFRNTLVGTLFYSAALFGGYFALTSRRTEPGRA